MATWISEVIYANSNNNKIIKSIFKKPAVVTDSALEV